MFIFVNTRGALRLIYFGPALDRLTFKGGSEQTLNKIVSWLSKWQ